VKRKKGGEREKPEEVEGGEERKRGEPILPFKSTFIGLQIILK
jgi:hypothetical protein